MAEFAQHCMLTQGRAGGEEHESGTLLDGIRVLADYGDFPSGEPAQNIGAQKDLLDFDRYGLSGGGTLNVGLGGSPENFAPEDKSGLFDEM